jgi:hypothetical protein
MLQRRSIGRRGVRAAGITALGLGAAWLGYRALARRPAASSADLVTYPPLDTPKSVAKNVWIVDSGPIVAMGLQLPVRMAIVRLLDGSLVLHSPTRYTAALGGMLSRLGEVRHLVAPSIAHWTFLPEWQAAYPKAETWGAPGLRERGQVRRSKVVIDAELTDQPPPEWADELAQGDIRGAAGFCEIYFFHKPSRTLLLTDLIENLEPEKLPAAMRLLMQAAAATSGTTALHVRALLLLGGKATAAAIDRMIALAPDRVIFAHGSYFAEDGAARLRRAFDWFSEGADAR